jgi:ubiquinone/menaquinone biosynthesis C-methylase UbiE
VASEYKDTFRGAAWYYARFREGYPDEFFDLIKREYNLSKSDRVLDLGCGTGQIPIPLAALVKEVVAMDPEPEMIAEGKKQAKIHGAENIVWIEGGSETLPEMEATLGRFKLVTMGTSFHWMDREKILNELYEIIIDGGGIVIVWNTSIWTRTPNDWQSAAKTVIKKYLGEERRAGSGYFQVLPRRHEEFVSESRFIRMETWTRHWVVSSTLDEVIGNLYSTSMANPYILGNSKEAFEEDLREALLKINSSGIFTSEGDLEAILAWK